MTALNQFQCYHDVWELKREDTLMEFMKTDPHLNEFETEILRYEQMEVEIMAQAEHYDVGPIALYTGDNCMKYTLIENKIGTQFALLVGVIIIIY